MCCVGWCYHGNGGIHFADTVTQASDVAVGTETMERTDPSVAGVRKQGDGMVADGMKQTKEEGFECSLSPHRFVGALMVQEGTVDVVREAAVP